MRISVVRKSEDTVAAEYLDLPTCSLTLDNSLPGLVVQWKGYATSTELRAVHEQLLDLIQKHRVSKILGDDTSLVSIAAEDRLWILENWMPRAIGAGLRVAAAKRSANYFARVALAEIENAMGQRMQIKMFDTLADAKAWLQAAPIDHVM
jgi:hypothetical protein